MRPTVNILSEELGDRILDEAMRILAEIGMEIRGEELRRRLLDHGLPTNGTGERVLFPRDVVERAIASAPASFVLYDRDGEPAADIGGDRVHFVPGSSGLKVLDHRTGETRLANSTDFVEYVRLGDGLEHIPYLATAFSTNDDIEAQVSDAWRLNLIASRPASRSRSYRSRSWASSRRSPRSGRPSSTRRTSSPGSRCATKLAHVSASSGPRSTQSAPLPHVIGAAGRLGFG